MLSRIDKSCFRCLFQVFGFEAYLPCYSTNIWLSKYNTSSTMIVKARIMGLNILTILYQRKTNFPLHKVGNHRMCFDGRSYFQYKHHPGVSSPCTAQWSTHIFWSLNLFNSVHLCVCCAFPIYCSSRGPKNVLF